MTRKFSHSDTNFGCKSVSLKENLSLGECQHCLTKGVPTVFEIIEVTGASMLLVTYYNRRRLSGYIVSNVWPKMEKPIYHSIPSSEFMR